MRFFVHSEADPRRVYLVDATANAGRMECACKDWRCRCWPVIRDGGRSFCKHCRAVREHIIDATLATMATAESQ